MKNEFIGYLLGNGTVALWGACVFFAALAATAMHKYRINKRDPLSPRSPQEFSWKFFWKDTWPRIFASFMFTLLGLRILFIWNIDTEWVIGIAALLGLLNDRLGALFSKAADAGNSLAENKIDEVVGKLKSTEAKVDTAKQEIKEATADLKDIKKDL